MGRSINSFTNWVGDTSMEGERVALPEKDLWVSVLSRAALDVVLNPNRLEHDQACSFFLKGGSHFRNICDMAGRNPDYVQAKMRKYILRDKGWNMDVPITSHYRTRVTRPKRGRPCVKNTRPI